MLLKTGLVLLILPGASITAPEAQLACAFPWFTVHASRALLNMIEVHTCLTNQQLLRCRLQPTVARMVKLQALPPQQFHRARHTLFECRDAAARKMHARTHM